MLSEDIVAMAGGWLHSRQSRDKEDAQAVAFKDNSIEVLGGIHASTCSTIANSQHVMRHGSSLVRVSCTLLLPASLNSSAVSQWSPSKV
jgi:hypothetical protein